MDQFFPETGMNMVKVLERVGCEVRYNANQTCCGQPAYNAGFNDASLEVANKFLDDFISEESDYIVAPSASCVIDRKRRGRTRQNRRAKIFIIILRSFHIGKTNRGLRFFDDRLGAAHLQKKATFKKLLWARRPSRQAGAPVLPKCRENSVTTVFLRYAREEKNGDS